MTQQRTRVTHIMALVKKEILTLLRDPKSRLVLIMPPLLQLLIFAYAATLEVKHVTIAILNQDYGRHGYEIVQRIHGSPIFEKLIFLANENEINRVIDQQKALAALVVPQDFSTRIEARQKANLDLILDGRRSNATQILAGYLGNIIAHYDREVAREHGEPAPVAIIIDRNWFNANLQYIWFTVPSLVGTLTMLVVLIITALSVSRERELGTFDQLLVSPLMPYEILIGKTIPAMLIGMAEGMVVWLIAVTLFHIPYQGSLLLLLMALFIFILSVVGVGLFISSISKTQQQAILGTFIFMVPSVTLSGYAAPVENMPHWLRLLDIINPLQHFMIISKGLFLKAMPFVDVWANAWPLLIIGGVTMPIAGWYFNKRVE